jgi:hypothetical protein
MKSQFKTIAVAVFASCFFFTAHAQINLLSNGITFRSYDNAANSTTHYGDLSLSGGSRGNGYGWLYSQAVTCYGWMDVYGNLNVYGTKNFIQPHPTDTTKVIKYVAIESGEALTLVRGLAKTVNGVALISLPEHFALVTSDSAPITVITTPEKVPAILFVKEKSKTDIVVAVKSSDYYEFGDIIFSYQVTGVRDGFENEEVIIDADKVNVPNDKTVSKNAVKNRISASSQKAKFMRQLKNSK